MIPDSKLVSDYLATAFRDKQSLITTADGKANILMGIIGVILSLFFKLFTSTQLKMQPLLALIIVPFIIAGLCAFATLFPRLPKMSGGSSLLYFRKTKNIEKDAFLDKSAEELGHSIYEDYIENIKALSEILAKKFFYLRLAYVFFGIGVVLKLVLEAFLLL